MRNKKAIAIAGLTIVGIVILIAAIILVPALTAVTAIDVVIVIEMCVVGCALYFAGKAVFRTIYEKVAGEKW